MLACWLSAAHLHRHDGNDEEAATVGKMNEVTRCSWRRLVMGAGEDDGRRAAVLDQREWDREWWEWTRDCDSVRSWRCTREPSASPWEHLEAAREIVVRTATDYETWEREILSNADLVLDLGIELGNWFFIFYFFLSFR